ncbi:hypothetical protein P8C59_007152 [Phyllachora maydis]|uniref:ATP synthase subunit H n=1 Tax=Phyllachora maydis TaxID=1825666 RepID=A0AAD9I8Z7_9PEZI|nr:hypothetical protein P8C59_007152 [Phyllachora maydis]
MCRMFIFTHDEILNCDLKSRNTQQQLGSSLLLHVHPTLDLDSLPTQTDAMISSISRVSGARKAIAAVSRIANNNNVAVASQMRTFIAPTVSRRADFVQELYLKELKSYKPAPIKDSDAAAHVQTFNLPKTPKSPEEADLASNLKEYESMAVEVEGQNADGAKPAALEDWLEDEEEEEEGHGHH